MSIDIDYKPHFYQRKFHEYADPEHSCFFVTQIAGRQAGKTLASEIQAIKYAFYDQNMLVWFVSPTDSQSEPIYNEILDLLQNTGLIKINNKNKGNRYIEFINGSRIEFKSAQARNALRGASVDFLIIDEATYIDEEIAYSVLFPTANVRGKKVVISTTPRGRNWTFQMFRHARDSEAYRSVRYTSFQNPHSNDEVIKLFKDQMPEEQYKQEILAEFIDGGAVFKNISELATINPAASDRQTRGVNFIGIDIGMLNDQTSICVINDNNEMVGLKYFQQNNNRYIQDRIIETIKEFDAKKAYIELNNQGLPIYNDLKERTNVIEGFTTTHNSKKEIINNLIAAFSKKEINILKDPQLINELEDFSFQVTSSGNLKFGGVAEHDDNVMSTAIAWHCKNKNEYFLNMDPKDLITGFDL